MHLSELGKIIVSKNIDEVVGKEGIAKARFCGKTKLILIDMVSIHEIVVLDAQ